MKTLLLLVFVVIPFKLGFATDTVTVLKEPVEINLDWQWSVTNKGYNFRQIAFWIKWERFDNRLIFPNFFAYQVPDGNGGNFSEFAIGGFYMPVEKKHFILNLGSYYMFSPEGMYILPVVNPIFEFWKFSSQISFLQYIPLNKKGIDQSVIFPLDFYFNIESLNLKIGVWNTWYHAEGLDKRQFRFGPSIIFENHFGKFRFHIHRRDPQGGWAFFFGHTIILY